jgi:hypothetical protein
MWKARGHLHAMRDAIRDVLREALPMRMWKARVGAPITEEDEACNEGGNQAHPSQRSSSFPSAHVSTPHASHFSLQLGQIQSSTGTLSSGGSRQRRW